jgi:hypothetical protein
MHVRSLRAHLALTRAMGARVALAQRHHPVLVGEWSLTHHMVGLAEAPEHVRAQACRRYAQAQLAAWDRGAGGCFWSLRNARYDRWSLERCVQQGWLDLRA